MSRLPGTCAGCGARVECSLGTRPMVENNGSTREYAPKVWVEPGTDKPHRCSR